MVEDYFKRLETIDSLIRIKGTGTPKQLASRLNISERSLYEFLQMMRSLGAPIKYSKFRQTYYYVENGGFNISFINY